MISKKVSDLKACYSSNNINNGFRIFINITIKNEFEFKE